MRGKPNCQSMLLLAIAAGGAYTGAFAEPPGPPGYKPLRYDENYSYLRDPERRSDFLDPIKYIPLNESGAAFLTLGGEVRERYEYFHNPLWGDAPQDHDGYLLQRYMLHADAHLGENFRVFAQFKSGLETGRVGGPRPPDRDEADLHQAFFDVKLPLPETNSFTLRAGRQELAYGSSRLISAREGPNVRQSFDAVRGMFALANARVDLFGGRPAETKPGVFDDGPDPERKLWGIYSVLPFPVLPGGKADVYYLGLENDNGEFDQGTARELRHSLGTRLWGEHANIDYNFEFVYQFGTFGDGDISAWTAASDTGYTFSNAALRPRLGLKADITSGDRNPRDPDLQTFNPLFPRGSYFSESGLIGPANHIDLHPSLDLQVRDDVTLTFDCDFFWRESDRDAVYGPAVNVQRSGQTSHALYVGSQPSVTLEYRINRHLTFVANYEHFFAGPFLRESGPGEDVDFVTTWLTFKF